MAEQIENPEQLPRLSNQQARQRTVRQDRQPFFYEILQTRQDKKTG